MRSRVNSLALWLAATILPLLSLPAAAAPPDADVEAGRQSYAKCIGCHSPDRNRTGPLHCGLIGRVSGTADDYDYSEAMRNAGITWTRENLDRFLAAPLQMVPGTTMGFAGIADDEERRNLIAWLAKLSGSSEFCKGIVEHQ